jgi:hypothetical protein
VCEWGNGGAGRECAGRQESVSASRVLYGQAMECTSYERGNEGACREACVHADRKVFISLNKLCVKSAQKLHFLPQRTGPDVLRSEARAGDSLPDDFLRRQRGILDHLLHSAGKALCTSLDSKASIAKVFL